MKRGLANRSHQKAVHEWNQANEQLPKSLFTDQILPTLQSVPLSDMAEATGLSLGYCSFIRRGLKVPHPRHWSALAAMVKSQVYWPLPSYGRGSELD